MAHLGLFPPSQVPELLACWLISLATMPVQANQEALQGVVRSSLTRCQASLDNATVGMLRMRL